MTKQEAKQTMLELSRAVIDPKMAEEIAAAFGETLASLKLQSMATKDFNRLNYTAETAELPSIAVYQLAKALAEKLTEEWVRSEMNGKGSYAEDITKKAVALLK